MNNLEANRHRDHERRIATLERELAALRASPSPSAVVDGSQLRNGETYRVLDGKLYQVSEERPPWLPSPSAGAVPEVNLGALVQQCEDPERGYVEGETVLVLVARLIAAEVEAERLADEMVRQGDRADDAESRAQRAEERLRDVIAALKQIDDERFELINKPLKPSLDEFVVRVSGIARAALAEVEKP